MRGDRGAVLVEFAFVMPILVMLLFGLVSAGISWNQNLALASGARAGARYAATLRTGDYTSMDNYLDAVAQRVVDSSEGALATSVTGRVICVAYVHNSSHLDLDKTRSRTETGTTVTRSDSSCYADNQADNETHIQISVQRSTTIETGVWSQTVTLQQKVVYRYEQSSGL